MQQATSYLAGMGNPFDGVLEAYGQGQIARQNHDLLKAKQAEQARKIQAQQELEQLDWNDQSAIAQLVAQYPEYTKGAKDYYDALEAKEQQSMLGGMSKAISALSSDRPDIAVQSMRDKANAYRDMGNESKAEEYSQLAEWMTRDPQAARKSLMMNYAVLSPEKSGANYENYIEAEAAEAAAPVDRAKTQAETVESYAGAKQKIATAGKLDEEVIDIQEMRPYVQAESKSKTSLNTANAGLAATRAEDIPVARADAQAQQVIDNQLAQLKLQLQSETNDVARQRLQVQIDKLNHTKAAYAAGLTTKQIETNKKNQQRLAAFDKNINAIEGTRSTIARLLNNKSGLKAATGALDGRLPSVRKNTLQFERDLETLQSQVFLTQVEKMRGLGALTDFEGKKLESGIANLSLVQSEEALERNLAIVYDAMQSFEQAARTEYQDLLGEVAQNPTGTSAGRSYMQYAN
jgi:hypothetical protein